VLSVFESLASRASGQKVVGEYPDPAFGLRPARMGFHKPAVPLRLPEGFHVAGRDKVGLSGQFLPVLRAVKLSVRAHCLQPFFRGQSDGVKP
jgi:hypothetical protein